MNAPQPCAHCGKPVRPGQGRQAGKPWWCKKQACRSAKRRHQQTTAARRHGQPEPNFAPASQPCAACGKLIPRGRGRNRNVDWYCLTPACQSEGANRRGTAYRRRNAASRPRQAAA